MVDELRIKVQLYAQEILWRRMKELCFEKHGEYWIDNWSIFLWEQIRDYNLGVPTVLSARDCDEFTVLAEDAEGWYHFRIGDVEPTFVPLVKWRRVYNSCREGLPEK